MALIGSLIALVGRFAGRVVTFALGWANILLFGKVDARKQVILGYVALGSLAWVAALLGVIIPDIGTFLLAFVPVPDFIDESWVRLAMLGAALLLPIVIGAAGYYLAEGGRPRNARSLLASLLRGYPFTALLATTIAFLAGVALVRRLRALARRNADAHVPMVVKPGMYAALVRDLHAVLTGAGLEVVVRPAPLVLSLPARLLDRVAGRSLGRLVPDRLMLLTGPGLEALIYPSDIAVVGEPRAVARARAAMASKLTEAPAWMTLTSEGQQLEDRIAALASSRPPADPAVLGELEAVDRTLEETAVPYEEWETLYRQRLQVERDILRRGSAGTRGEPRLQVTIGSLRAAPDGASRLGVAAAVGVLALLALDAALLILTAFRRPSRTGPGGR